MRRTALAAFLVLPLIAAAPQPASEQSPAPSTVAAAATPISTLSFLPGVWRGQQNGDLIEETWSEPRGGHIQGMFRWMQGEGGPGMMELLSITTEPDGVYLRLRHFDSKLTPWASESGGPITLRLDADASKPNLAIFKAVETETHLAGVTYDHTTPGALKINITFPTPADGKPAREPLIIDLKRATPAH